MTINTLVAEVARERRHDMVRNARDYRTAHGARPVRRARRAGRLTVRIRPIRPADTGLLTEIFGQLSPASRLARFLYPKLALSESELRYLTEVDHSDHEALIALTRFGRRPIGVARYIRHRDDPTSAEIAVAVVDEWQNRRLGSMLTTGLSARAVCENVSHFTALMSADNLRARRLLAQVGEVTFVAREGSTVIYRATLPGPAPKPARRRPFTLAPAGSA